MLALSKSLAFGAWLTIDHAHDRAQGGGRSQTASTKGRYQERENESAKCDIQHQGRVVGHSVSHSIFNSKCLEDLKNALCHLGGGQEEFIAKGM